MSPRRRPPPRAPGPELGEPVPSTTDTCDDALARVRQAVALVREALQIAVPEELTPGEARRMTHALGALHKLVGTSSVRCSRRAGRDAAAVLALAQGSSMTKAKTGLSLLERASAVPAMRRAFDDGLVSLEQAAVIAPILRSAPATVGPLIERAKSAPVSQLRQEVARSLRRAHREEAQVAIERHLHERRFCRLSFPDGGGVRLQAFFGPIQGARVKAALERATDGRLRASPGSGALGSTGTKNAAAGPRGDGQWSGGALERLRADALAGLVAGGPRAQGGAAGPQVLVRVDAAALRRGDVGDGELCEIAGVGPVSVEAARSLLGDGFFTVLVEDGVDIRTVTSTRRSIPRRVRAALMLRDQCCVVPGCGAVDRLEIDHWQIDFAWRGPAELENLCRLCSTHHAMKTQQGWQLGGGPGHWWWLPPRTVSELAGKRSRRSRPGVDHAGGAHQKASRPRPDRHAPSGFGAERADGDPSRQTGRRPRAGPPHGARADGEPP